MKKLEYFLLALIILGGLSLRLYKVNRPIADWHSWRQADTAAVSRNFIKDGFNPLIPKFDDMSKQANGLDNPNRYRFVEFPIYNALIAAVWKVFGVSVIYARLVTVFISLGSTLALYFLVRHFSGIKTGLLASFFFAAIPYNVFYSSAILPGPLMVFSTLLFYISYVLWLEKNKIVYFMLAIFFANIAILTWPIAIFFTIPALYLAFDKFGFSTIKNLKLWTLAILSITPFIAWRIWMTNFPQGIPNYLFLINEGAIRFKGAFFWWLIQERLGGLILSSTGFALFILGLAIKPKTKEKLFYLSILLSAVVYFVVFASGNVRHDYYQIPIVPILSIYMAIGIKALIDTKSQLIHRKALLINKFIGPAAALALIILTFAFGYFQIKGYYWINKPEIVDAGNAVDRLLPKDATIIAPYNGDAAFLYQTNRRGYPITDRPLEDYVKQGTKYLVSVDVGDSGIQNLAKNCSVIEQTSTYVILELSQECI